MAWLTLFVAGLLEMVWAILLKQSAGLTRPLPTIGFFVSLLLSMVLLAQALKTLPVGTAYAVWTGIGAAGTAIGQQRARSGATIKDRQRALTQSALLSGHHSTSL